MGLKRTQNGLKSRAVFLLEYLAWNLFPCPFQFLEAAHIFWLTVLFCLQSQNLITPTSAFIVTSLPLSLTLLPLYFPHKERTHLDRPGNLTISKILHLIISAKSLLPCKVTYSLVLGIRTWTTLRVAGRAIFSLPQVPRSHNWVAAWTGFE